MQLYYYRDAKGNFGDDLNAWLWPRLLTGVMDSRPDALLLGIGTLLNTRVPPDPMKHVLGSGVGYGTVPQIDATWDVRFLRGPLTCDALGLPRHLAITDPAALVSLFVQRSAPNGVAIMPHHLSVPFLDWPRVCALGGFRFINPAGGVEEVLNEIAGSQIVIAEAMHGAIVADALRIPWIPMQIYPQFLPFKWHDWMESLGIVADISCVVPEYDGSERSMPRRLAARLLGRLDFPARAHRRMVDRLAALAQREPVLSDTNRFETAVQRMREAVERFRRDLGGREAA